MRAGTAQVHDVAMNHRPTVEFTLPSPGSGGPLDVRMRRTGERWAVSVTGESETTAIALSARQALAAALAPLGEPAVKQLLADLRLLEPSCRIVALERTDIA